MVRKGDPNLDPNDNDSKDKHRLFRHGELIHKFYKYVGLMPDDESKMNAKDFSENFKLLKNASFGDEQIIMFREKEIQ